MSRFEIVRTDAGWHARFRANNGKLLMSSEVYTRRTAALTAVHRIARSMSPTARIWVSNIYVSGKPSGSIIKFGHPDDSYLDAHPIEVRDVDERGAS